MMKLLFSVTILIFSSKILIAQSIFGTILDKNSAKPVPFANVFLNSTTNGTTTDVNGNFIILNVRPGSYELVVSFVGYNSYKQPIVMGTQPIQLGKIFLTESRSELSTVEVVSTRDKKWEKQIKKFEKIFLGSDKFSSTSKIINPWVINFPKDTVGNKFIAETTEPIQIINNGLGYKITYYLDRFWAQRTDYEISGSTRFEELISSDEKLLSRWKNNRASCFTRSYNYLFKAIIDKMVARSGFKVYSKEEITNSQANRLGLENWVTFDTTRIKSEENSNQFAIYMKGWIQVLQMTKGKGTQSYILVKNDTVKTNRNGFVINPKDIIVYGDYNNNRAASILPSDYEPDQTIIMHQMDSLVATQFAEKIYVHTDKPYYYPRETIWFKGYLNYGAPSWRDSLSRVAYVELISPDKTLVNSKKILIDSGFFYNEFLLPDSLQAGSYLIRAYTNLSRNFGTQGIFNKRIQILNMTDKVVASNVRPDNTNSLIEIIPSKEVYKTRETIVLHLTTRDEYGEPTSANMSISVTDVFQVAEVAEKETILTSYPFKTNEVINPLDFRYPMEPGISFSGSFVNDKNKPEILQLNFMDVKSGQLYSTITDSNGLFSKSGLQFYDSAYVMVTTERTKNEPYGYVALYERDIPPILFEPTQPSFEIINTNSDQRIISDYEFPKEAIQLAEVVIKGKKIVKSERAFRSYGYPDLVINGKDINPNNILFDLMKVPGIQVDIMTNSIYFIRAATQSISHGGLPLITIDDVPMGGQSPGEILTTLNPASIESIEITKRLNPLYGSEGANGVIAVYLKHGPVGEMEINPNFQILKLKGYDQPRTFLAPNYNDTTSEISSADYRSTIYWNPLVVTNEKDGTIELKFSAADLPGRYRIIVEGINQNGLPLRNTYFIEVEDR